MRKILVLRGGALGDFIVTLPTLAALRGAWPDAEIHLAGNATAAQLALHRGLLAAVYSQHEARWSALYTSEPLPDSLRSWLERFDLIVSYWPDPDGTIASHLPVRAEQRYVAGDPMPQAGPAAAHYSSVLNSLGVAARPNHFDLRPLAAPSPSHRGILVHPGSGSPRKNWPKAHWEALFANLPGPLTLVLGEAEGAEWLVKDVDLLRASDGTVMRVLTGASLETLVTELHGCRLFIGHDSGISHLAAASGAPCVLLFGPTDPAIWAPPSPRVKVIRHTPALDSIGVATVLSAVQDELSSPLDQQ